MALTAFLPFYHLYSLTFYQIGFYCQRLIDAKTDSERGCTMWQVVRLATYRSEGLTKEGGETESDRDRAGATDRAVAVQGERVELWQGVLSPRSVWLRVAGKSSLHGVPTL